MNKIIEYQSRLAFCQAQAQAVLDAQLKRTWQSVADGYKFLIELEARNGAPAVRVFHETSQSDSV